MIDPEIVINLVAYNPETGVLTFRSATPDMFSDGRKSAKHVCAIWNAKNAAKPAFSARHSAGYLAGSLLGRKFLAHRIAWVIAKGEWPDGEIDHINHDRGDNRLVNLRQTTREENSKNLSMSINCPNGATGVYWYARTSRWVAKISIRGRSTHLGYFPEKTMAIAARKQAELRHGFHKNHGVIQ